MHVKSTTVTFTKEEQKKLLDYLQGYPGDVGNFAIDFINHLTNSRTISFSREGASIIAALLQNHYDLTQEIFDDPVRFSKFEEDNSHLINIFHTLRLISKEF